jgi:hypothetical protein
MLEKKGGGVRATSACARPVLIIYIYGSDQVLMMKWTFRWSTDQEVSAMVKFWLENKRFSQVLIREWEIWFGQVLIRK